MNTLNSIDLNLIDADIIYYPNLFTKNEADRLFTKLLNTLSWQQDNITIYGKTHLQPRLTALYATNLKTYKYSNILMHPKPYTKDLLTIKLLIEKTTNIKFTSCLANLYKNGHDSNGWHSDNEKELGVNPVIASVSFGAERIFHLKHKTDKDLKHKLCLEHGSLLLMKGETQHKWLHQLPKTKKLIGERINLTFRIIA